jgi:ATP-dependent exoDNAse (exonuclease V) beta subunit
MNDKRFTFVYTNKELSQIYKVDYPTRVDDAVEWEYFLEFVRDHPHLKPYRTEWMIFDEDLKIAGSIDMVYENPDGTLSIYDWKRSKEITKVNNWNKFATNQLISHFPDANFWHYALQLNTYKAILEAKYGKTVKDLYLVRLHPDIQEKTYELLQVPILEKEMYDLLEERKRKFV